MEQDKLDCISRYAHTKLASYLKMRLFQPAYLTHFPSAWWACVQDKY